MKKRTLAGLGILSVFATAFCTAEALPPQEAPYTPPGASSKKANRANDTQQVPLSKMDAKYEADMAAFNKTKEEYNEKMKAAQAKKKKNPAYVMPVLPRPQFPQNPYVYPEAEERADVEYAKIAPQAQAMQAQFNKEMEHFNKVVRPAYDRAMKDYKAAMDKYNQEKRKNPKTKLTPPAKPASPKSPARPNTRRMVKVDEGKDVKAYRGYGRNGEIRMPILIKTAGKYSFFVRYYRAANNYANIAFRIQAPDEESVRFTWINPVPQANKPIEQLQAKNASGFVWEKIDFEAEYPGAYMLNISSFKRDNKLWQNAPFAIAEVWFSNNPKFNPEKASASSATAAKTEYVIPQGFQAARPHAPHVYMNTVIKDVQKRLITGFHQCYPYFEDNANMLNLGAVADLTGDPAENGKKYGATFCANPDFGRGLENELAKKYPMPKADPQNPDAKLPDPVGRIAWSNGEFGKGFSDSFQEYLDLCRAAAEKSVQEQLASEAEPYIGMWWTAWEQCGNYDYGPTSVEAYRKFLKEKHGSIENLNKAWHTSYKSFNEIKPAKHADVVGKDKLTDELARLQAGANFIDFRTFCSREYASKIRLKTEAAFKYDKKYRHISSNLSCNNISSVMWMQWRPLSFEDTAQITMKGSDMIGYDNYGTDDLVGANYEIFDAFGDGKMTPMIREGATHAPDPDLMARMQWGNIAKGMRGMMSFCIHESGRGELTKFGMSDMFDNASPRPKLAAIADNYRAMHQLDYLLSETKRTRANKPVAIYYSSTCNVMQEKPYASIFDCGPDNFFRVYELIRANGYEVTFITDRQIRETNWIDTLQGIFFIDASYIPLDVQDKVQKWVEKGGHIVCDAQSGSLDGYGFPTKKMVDFLGIEPKKQQAVDKMAAEKLAFGYSAYSFDVINRDELYKTACEYKDAPGSTHPISKQVGKLMISSLGYQEVKCLDGEALILENNGRPAWIIRDHGKGTSSYFSGYLGTIYGSGCTQIEWRDNHADPSPYRFIDAYLNYIGAKKTAVSDQEKEVALAMRFEAPLVDGRGNAAMGMISQNRHTLDSFRLKYTLPKNVKEPKMMLAVTNASRKITQVPFKFNAQDRTLTFRMPGFRAHGTAMALNNLEPMVSVEFVNAQRDAYNLADVRPDGELTAKVKVFNPSSKPLPAGRVTLRLPEGWFYDKEMVEVPSVSPYAASQEFTFKIKAPAVNAARRLRAINFVYENENVKSAPSVEMVWFQKEPLNPKAESFDIE